MMKLKKMKGLLASLCMGLLLITACTEREGEGFAGYDTADWKDRDLDVDDRLSPDEFRTAYRDTDYFNEWDANRDQAVDEDEWNNALNKLGPGYEEGEYGSFDDWDADADGVLNDRELGDGVFAYYDTNNDSYLVEEEYGVWNSGYDYQKIDRPN